MKKFLDHQNRRRLAFARGAEGVEAGSAPIIGPGAGGEGRGAQFVNNYFEVSLADCFNQS
jgi:hypothetical protein